MTTMLEIGVDLAALLTAVAWPLAVLLVAYFYRDAILQLFERLPGRLTKLSVGGVSVELAQARELAPKWFGPGVVDLRKAGQSADVNDSTARTFIEQLKDPTRLDYAIVDLGDGRQWLTSRLYILAIVLQRMRGLQAFVFLETAGDVRRKYFGVASCEQVRWALARRFQWLERDFAQAYGRISQENNGFDVVSADGRLSAPFMPDDLTPAVNLVRYFIANVQVPPVDPQEWATINEETDQQEHASWLTAALLEEIMGTALHSGYVRSRDLIELTEAQKAQLFREQSGDYVALVRDDGRFEALIDRTQVLERIAATLLVSSS